MCKYLAIMILNIKFVIDIKTLRFQKIFIEMVKWRLASYEGRFSGQRNQVSHFLNPI